jgi:hypothetical protein
LLLPYDEIVTETGARDVGGTPMGEMGDIDRPIFIVGVDHSGTTVFYRMMARHPKLAWFTPYSLRGGELEGRARVPFNRLINRVGRRVIPWTWHKRPRAGFPYPEPREAPSIWRLLVPRTEGFLDDEQYTEEQAEVVRGAFRAELEAWRLRRMLVKIPYLTRTLALLDRIFPDARYVHIVRDGKAVALSNRSRYQDGGRDPGEALHAGAVQWRDTLHYIEGLNGRIGDRMHTVRYEEFCADVHGSVREAFRFCGLDPAEAPLEGIPKTLHPTNGKRLSQSSVPDRLLLNDLLEPTLVRWGYAPFQNGELSAEPLAAQESDATTARGGSSTTAHVARATAPEA